MIEVLKSIIPVFPKQELEERIGTIMPSPTMAGMYPYIFDSIKVYEIYGGLLVWKI